MKRDDETEGTKATTEETQRRVNDPPPPASEVFGARSDGEVLQMYE